MIELVSNSTDETIAIGQNIANNITASSTIALKGQIGSGKTYLTKGIALGLGIKELLTSPTYTIINEYPRTAQPTLYHIDAYRLNNEKDFEDIGGIEIINSKGIVIIEWSERILNSLPSDTVTITIEITDLTSRLIKIDGLEIS